MPEHHPLLALLRSRAPELASEADHLLNRAAEILPRTLSTFPSGTDHTVRHTNTVEFIASLLIEPRLAQDLRDDEILMLLLACHYHDLGMAGTEWHNTDASTRDQARRDHAIRVGTLLGQRWRDLGFVDERIATVLAEVCRGHRPTRDGEGIAHWDEYEELEVLSPGRSVRVRLVAAIVFAADELHIGADRARHREQDHLRMTDQESLRHWTRHQHLHGPVFNSGAVCFDAEVTTSTQEDDLKREVLRKALLAVESLRRQLSAEEIPHLPPAFRIRWNRRKEWQLLLLEAAAAQDGLTRDSLQDEVFLEFTRRAAPLDALVDLASEVPADEDALRRELLRVTHDMIATRMLVEDPETRTVSLSAEPSVIDDVLAAAREADRLERLFNDPLAARHEQLIYGSRSVVRMMEERLYPAIKLHLGVDLAVESSDSPLRQLLSCSPTAGQFLSHLHPTPNILVRRQPLALTILAGATMDAYQNPDLLLEPGFRKALRELSEAFASQMPGTISFLEELALVQGMPVEKVWGSIVRPQDADESDASPTTIKVQQAFKKNDPVGYALPSIILAGHRAGEKVELRADNVTPLRIKIDHPDPAPANAPDISNAVAISIGPGEPHAPPRIDLRAELDFDAEAGRVDLVCRPLSDLAATECALLVGVPGGPLEGGRAATAHLSLRSNAATIATLATINRIRDLGQTRSIELRMLLGEDRRILSQATLPAGKRLGLRHPFADRIVERLESIDPTLPVPWFLLDDLERHLLDPGADEAVVADEVRSAVKRADRPEVTTVSLRLANVGGQPFREVGPIYLPLGMSFSAPVLSPDSQMTQEEWERRWSAHDSEMVMTAYSLPSPLSLMEELRAWLKDPSREFPVSFGGKDVDVPTCASRFEMMFGPKLDRRWYVEIPVTITVRPVTKQEQLKAELEYWIAVKDDMRAELVRERLARLQQPSGRDTATLPAPPADEPAT